MARGDVNPLLEQSDYAQKWLDNQMNTNPNVSRTFDKFRYGISYKRFNTVVMDGIIPDSTTALSAWKTSTFCYYEIVLKNGLLSISFSCNNTIDLPEEIKSVYTEIILPVMDRDINEGRAYFTYRMLDRLPVTPQTTEEEIVNYLDKSMQELVSFEKRVIEFMRRKLTIEKNTDL